MSSPRGAAEGPTRWRRLVGPGLALAISGLGLLAWTRMLGPVARASERAQEGAFTLYLLGGSTALGDPYHPRADFGQVVAWLLGGEVGGRPIQVVNLGGLGKHSAAALEDARRVAQGSHEPGTAAALLYLGNNEFLRFDEDHDLSQNQRTLFDEPTLPPVARATVLETYARNIEGIVEALQGAGVGVIGASTAVNLKDWEPNRSVLADRRNGPEVRRLLSEAEREGAAGRPEAALAALLRILELEPCFALASKLAGDELLALGRPAEARARYQDAIDHDGNPYRETSEQERLLRELCAALGVPVVDAAALLEAASPDGLIGYELMWDNCHPTLAGYARIAEGFAHVLVGRYGAVLAREGLDLAALEEHLGFDDAFRSQVLATRGQFCYVSSSLTWDPRPRLARAGHYLERALALTPDDVELWCSRAVWLACKGEAESSLAEWRRAFARDPRLTRERAKLPQIRQVMARCGVASWPSVLRASR